MLSVILPTYNEAQSGYLEPILSILAQLQDAEVIVVDSGSTDGTLELIEKRGFTLFVNEGASRAARLNTGIAAATGETIFLHHPRSLVQPEGFKAVEEYAAAHAGCWGGLSHQFDFDHALLRFTSWYSNKVRCDRSGIIYWNTRM